MTQIRRLLSTSRLVTLTGAGGVGKTRLAQRVGGDMRRAFPDGVWFVELSELRDPDLLAVTVAETLGIREESVSADAPGLARFLADQQALIVLDNCEQLIGPCADLAALLLRRCPEIRIMTTSRQALSVAGEATLTVQPLSVPDPDVPVTAAELARIESATLLVERAAAVQPGFEMTEENAGTIARLCQALEGVPLAIELAVARLRALSLDQILDRLTDRFRLLTSGARNAPARQQTLRALIDWSWELCSAPERTLWARLSVFSGGLTLDAAEQVCADETLPAPSMLDLIASLVDKSVLTRIGDDGQARYRMLEVVREYGAMRLAEAGDQARLAELHCGYYAALAHYGDRHWVSPDQAALMQRLRQEQANLRVALEWTVREGPAERALRFVADLENHWTLRGFLSEGRHWQDRALAMPSPTVTRARVRLLRSAAWIAIVQDDGERGERFLAEARRLVADLPPSIELAYLPLIEGNLAMFRGDLAEALTLFQTAHDVFRRFGARSGEMWTLACLGLTRGFSGRPSDGYPDLIACRDMGEAEGEVWWRSFALWALSVLHWQDGDNAGATAAAKESLQVRKPVEGEQFGVGLSVESLAWIAGSEQRDQRAARLLGASLRMWQAMHTSLASFRSLSKFHDDTMAAVRARMGERAFESALRRGAAMSTADAVALALESAAPAGRTPAQRTSTDGSGLTKRERQVAALIADGLSNREIAARLVVAQRTAEGHVENILSKLGFTSRAQVAGWLAAQNSDNS
ncbi:LuxR C-terminal-related transcriptional regulator [Actinoplanes sp. NPDC051633]|uniref:ATP-binding protein n=1 Tax=Actinoplanes sp. NPDC051633 TaxID=3155670 RepID=UPI003422F6B4